MSATTYIQNSPSSNAGADLQFTAFGCVGVVNGTLTVCSYYSNLPIGSWVKATTESGVHIQAHPNSNPTGVWSMASGYFVVTINTTDNTITYASTGSRPLPAELTKIAGTKPPEVKARPLQPTGYR